MGVFRGIAEKIKSGLARGLTEAPKFIRGIAEKVRKVPILGTIAKTAYESLVPESIRSGIDTSLDIAEQAGHYLSGQPMKPKGPPPPPPGKESSLKKPNKPPPPPPKEGITEEDIQSVKLKKPGMKKPTGPLPPPPSQREQMMSQIQSKRKY